MDEDREEGEDDALPGWNGPGPFYDKSVSGFDDLIAARLNSWEKASRKRRFFGGA